MSPRLSLLSPIAFFGLTQARSGIPQFIGRKVFGIRNSITHGGAPPRNTPVSQRRQPITLNRSPAAKFSQLNLTDPATSARFGVGIRNDSPWLMKFLTAITRRADPILGASLVALAGGRMSTLLTRLVRLRRVAGAVLHGDLTPPAPVKLQIETTNLCNLRCVHCKREKLDEMNTLTISLDAFKRIISDIKPYYANLAGFGEPLIDRSIVAKLSLLHQQGTRTSLPTNGTYIRRHKREELAAELPDILQLSIDGATKESFEAIRKLGDFDSILDNYRAICALRADGKTRSGTVIRVLCALQRGNLHDYGAMYRLTKSLQSIDSFGLVPVSYGSTKAAQIPTKDEVLALHRELDIAITSTQDDDEKRFYQQWRNVSGEWLKNKAGDCHRNADINQTPCSVPWFSTYIDAKQRVYPCCYLTGTEHVMGTLGKDGSGFDEIWKGARYRAFRSDLLSARSRLSGCNTCPRNDKAVLSTLVKIRSLLPQPRSTASSL